MMFGSVMFYWLLSVRISAASGAVIRAETEKWSRHGRKTLEFDSLDQQSYVGIMKRRWTNTAVEKKIG